MKENWLQDRTVPVKLKNYIGKGMDIDWPVGHPMFVWDRYKYLRDQGFKLGEGKE